MDVDNDDDGYRSWRVLVVPKSLRIDMLWFGLNRGSSRVPFGRLMQ